MAILAAAGLFALSGGGCRKEVPASRITVVRGHLEPTESVKQWQMATGRAFYAEQPGNWVTVVIPYQLPGAKVDSKFPVYAYYLYLHVQGGPGIHRMTTGGSQAAYFLWVTKRPGEVKELKLAREGTVTAEAIVPGDALFNGSFELTCTEGTTLAGQFTAKPDPKAVEQFEALYLPAAAER